MKNRITQKELEQNTERQCLWSGRGVLLFHPVTGYTAAFYMEHMKAAGADFGGLEIQWEAA